MYAIIQKCILLGNTVIIVNIVKMLAKEYVFSAQVIYKSFIACVEKKNKGWSINKFTLATFNSNNNIV